MGAGSFVQEVCVVDDDRQVADLLGVLLTNAGFTVRTFDSARSFLNTPSLPRCACLVVNLTLREMSALELQLTLQRYNAPCCVVFLSDPESVRDSVRAMKLGAFTYSCAAHRHRSPDQHGACGARGSLQQSEPDITNCLLSGGAGRRLHRENSRYSNSWQQAGRTRKSLPPSASRTGR